MKLTVLSNKMLRVFFGECFNVKLKHTLIALIAAVVPATSVAGDKAVKFYIDPLSANGMPSDVAAAIEDKLLTALTRTEAVDMSQHNVFRIIPNIDFTEVAETEGMVREVARVQADLKLTACNMGDAVVYHTVTIPLKGSAAGGKDAAMRKLANSLKSTDPVFVRFVRTSRERIHDHYTENCSDIIAHAQRLRKIRCYAEAASYLTAVPPSVACYDQAEAVLDEVMTAMTPQTPDTVVIVEQVEVPVQPQTVVEEVVETPVQHVPETTPVVDTAIPGSGGLGKVTIDGQDLEFEITGCVGDMTRRAINITARVINTSMDYSRSYVYLENAITPDGDELKDFSIGSSNYNGQYLSTPEGVPVTLKFSIRKIRNRIDKLSYIGLTVRGIKVQVRDLPVSWQ